MKHVFNMHHSTGQLNAAPRREFVQALASALALAPAFAGATSSNSDHDMGTMAAWRGKEQIAMLIYPQFTALDMVGPQHMLASLMGAKLHIVAKTLEPIKSDTGLVFVPSATFESCPKDIDIMFVPGGTNGTLDVINDEQSLAFVADRSERAKLITSVCTGSLILGAAGLLKGYRATSHWATRDLLKLVGAEPVDQRVVRDRNRITGAGVTAGLDFGLSIVQDLRDTTYAQGVQLLAEYAPLPPLNAGSTHTAPVAVRQLLDKMYAGFVGKTSAALKKSKGAA
jgi:cyclohexyl-isocyanide hydratase